MPTVIFPAEFYPDPADKAAIAAGMEQLRAEQRAHRLAEVRRRLGITQADVATRMGVTQSRRFVRSVRRAGPDRPGERAASRPVTGGCSSTCGTGSRPSGIARAASFPAARSRFFARSRSCGPAAVTTCRANAATGMVLPGSITQRRTRCGRDGCACRADPPRLHGPYWQWTRKVAARTVCRWLSPAQRQDYQAWIDNDRRLRDLLARLEALGAAALDTDPRWKREPRAAPSRTGQNTR